MPAVMRILDANANRAREALRVMEEAARFLLDDADLAAGLKQLRHDLASAMSQLSSANVELWRDTPGDVGTTLSTDAERDRPSAAHAVVAASKRLSEALRSLEEYGKTIDSAFAAAVEPMRYRGYDLEQRLHRMLAGGRARQWRLCVLLSASLCPGGDWLRVARAAVEGGADALQLREKTLADDELLERAARLVDLCRPAGVAVIVNDRPDVAVLAGADGVHLGRSDLPCAAVRRLVGRQLLIGVSTSSLEQARQAWRDGADYCGIGPMFPTTTKHKKTIVGPDYLRRYLAWDKLPHLAIGGIVSATVAELAAAGVRGVAVSNAVCTADDPGGVCRRLLEALPPLRFP